MDRLAFSRFEIRNKIFSILREHSGGLSLMEIITIISFDLKIDENQVKGMIEVILRNAVHEASISLIHGQYIWQASASDVRCMPFLHALGTVEQMNCCIPYEQQITMQHMNRGIPPMNYCIPYEPQILTPNVPDIYNSPNSEPHRRFIRRRPSSQSRATVVNTNGHSNGIQHSEDESIQSPNVPDIYNLPNSEPHRRFRRRQPSSQSHATVVNTNGHSNGIQHSEGETLQSQANGEIQNQVNTDSPIGNRMIYGNITVSF